MRSRDDFVDHLLDQLDPLGAVTAKSMFGGYGIYCDGVMFGIVADGAIYLKVDDLTRADYEREGLEPFTYVKQGKRVALSYHAAPADAVDNPEVMRAWAGKALDVAVRAARTRRA